MNNNHGSKTLCQFSRFMLVMAWLMMASTLSYANDRTKSVVCSPDRIIQVQPLGSGLSICYKQKPVLQIPALGYGQAVGLPQFQLSSRIDDDYLMVAGKRRHCVNHANEYVARLDEHTQLVMRVYNDGVAFRYLIAGLEGQPIPKELTSFRIPEGTNRWMQQWTDSYEGFYPLATSCKSLPVPSYSGVSKSADGWNNRWGFPALLQAADDVFALITEANIGRKQSASCLFNDGDCFMVVPDHNTQPMDHEWRSPWRVVIVGSLAQVVQSTLVTDVSESARIDDRSWIKPGAVSWIYWAYNHGSNDFNIIRQYVDMAVNLQLPYVLIDAEWDQMKDGKTIVDAVQYANSHGVKPLIWYNSSVGWVDGAPTPKYRLNKPEDREREFQWCEDIGVAGVKIDFFSGDSQENMDFCLDLLEAAARHHLLVNFHGATIPRGWQRTWPNLMSTEGVYGAEWYNNVPTFTDKAAAHNATLPFTRNVVGPMDYTPCAFSDSQHPHITTLAHELALTVLFESALQHLADRPESYLSQPDEVQDFLSKLPTAWDDTRLIAGYPAEYAVIARKAGDKWYVAGVNGSDNNRLIKLSLPKILREKHDVTMFLDGQDGGWNIVSKTDTRIPQTIECKPRGGFLLVVQ